MPPVKSARSAKSISLLAAIAAATATVLAVPASSAGAATAGTRLMGVHLDDSANPSSAQAAWKESLLQAELDAGRRLDLVSTSPYGFGATFPSWREPWIVQNGSEPVINWTSAASAGIIKGAKDSTLAARADALAAFGSPVVLEFAPGMDNPALASTISTPANFKASWIHVHNLFAAHGATNVSWAWCPSATSWANGTAMQWYPGSQYVDSVCAQGATVTPDVSFASEFGAFDAAAATLGKPMMISSFGVSEGADGAKAQWLTEAYNTLANTFTNVSAVIEDGTGAAAMTTTSAAESAWAAGVSQAALYTAPAVTLPSGPLVPASGTLLGSMLTKGNKTSEPAAWDSLEAMSSGNVRLAQTIAPWGDTIPTWRDTYNISKGRIPMISWGGTTTTDITAGTYDSYIRSTATAIKALGSPVFLRWFWEMDGTFFAPQAVSPAAFKAAWAHIHTIFDSVGATNAVWVWSPTAYGFTNGNAQPFYPGNDLVDWVAADGFNFYPMVPNSSPVSFANIFTAFTAWGTSVGKPMMVAATGSLENSDPMAKATWIRNMARTVQVLDPGIRAICYLDEPSGSYSNPGLTLPWQLTTSPYASQAWSDIAQQPTFANAR